MKKLLAGAIALLPFLGHLNAAELTTHLIEVGAVRPGDTQVPVLAAEEGRVLWVDARDEALVHALQEAQVKGQQVRVDFDEENGTLHGVVLLDRVVTKSATPTTYLKENFVPSVIDLEQATTIFKRLDGNTKRRSQCFNRAHGWAYDMDRLFGIKSMKVFVFFTQRYIRNYRYKWWFHVAPFVLTKNGESVQESVLDVSFTKGPTEMRDWTNQFVKSHQACPTVQTYSHYRNNQQTSDCYLMKPNMYYRSPRDLELLESEGRQEIGWNSSEVREARRQAFDNWSSYSP